MKYGTSRKLKNIILSIIFAILELLFLSCLSNFLKNVGMKIFFFFFWKAIKIAGSAQKTGSVGLVETQVLFLGLMYEFFEVGLTLSSAFNKR